MSSKGMHAIDQNSFQIRYDCTRVWCLPKHRRKSRKRMYAVGHINFLIRCYPVNLKVLEYLVLGAKI